MEKRMEKAIELAKIRNNEESFNQNHWNILPGRK